MTSFKTCTTHLSRVLLTAHLALAAGCVVTDSPTEAEQELSALELVENHCTRCHLAPEPGDLSKEYWSYALHYMGNYVGMKGDEFDDMTVSPVPPEWEPQKDYTKRYFLSDELGYMRDLYPFKPYIPPEPEMTKAEFVRMREYFVGNARSWPDMEIKRPKAPIVPGFTPAFPNLDLEPNALVLATQVDPKRRRIYVGRSVIDDWIGGGGRKEGFDKWDDIVVFNLDSGKRIAQANVESDPLHMSLTETGVRVLTHGRFPMTEVGIAALTDWEFEGGKARARMLVNGKQRFVRHHEHDMNGDGLDDIVANAFGDGIFGDANSELTIFWQTPQYSKLWKDAPAEIKPGLLPGALRETIVSNQSGLISSSIADFNKDGRPDIAALVAQGSQELLLFINNGDETFTRHLLEENRPSFGGNNVRAADFDGDGNIDLAVLNGDNVAGNHVGPIVPAPRPQHSVRVFKNNGNLNFTKEYHYSMHGATRSVVEDFDSDGDLDIAVISLFPQWSAEEPESFVYLENKGNFDFSPQSFSSDFFSVWSSIEAADVNGDNKTDIILGLGNFPELVPPDWLTRPIMEGRDGNAASVIYLLNNH
ncbi:MAG: VCBS repeat-containing protein [Halieaceae bacterium]|jgi:hypothetical protein|nr:VCBS repeat-containing protein [Halieaceae bacterium]